MKILISNHTLEINGLTTVCIRLARGMQNLALAQTTLVVYYRTPNDQLDHARRLGIQTHALGSKSYFKSRYHSRLLNYVAQEKPDIFLATSRSDLESSLNFPPNVRTYYRIGSSVSQHRENYIRFHDKIAGWIACAPELIAEFPNKERITLIPNWIETKQNNVRPPKKLLHLVYCGRLTQEPKRIFDLIELALRLKKIGLRFLLTIMGAGPEETALRRRINQKNLTEVVKLEYPYFCEDYANRLKNQHLLIHCSEREGCSLSILEAMSLGIVPIAADGQGGIRHLVRPNETGLLFPVGDIGMLALHVLSLAGDFKKYLRLAEGALSLVKSQFSEKIAMKNFRDLFGEDMNKNRPSPPLLIGLNRG
ncbi:MAG: glycosyltransferase family 4 protein [Elusimicrobia bacterium]|nr:glycosyltransferase family 4 protein [Elusimicrobiota bacterium]